MSASGTRRQRSPEREDGTSAPPPPLKKGKRGRATIDSFFVSTGGGSSSKAGPSAASSSKGATSVPTLSPSELEEATALFETALQTARETGSFSVLKDLIPPSWLPFLGPEVKKPYFRKLQAFLEGEQSKGVQIFPPAAMVFNCFRLCELPDLKVVIIGQDPYHDDGQAMGMSFSVPEGVRVPSSLLNIYKEIHSDLGDFPRPKSGDLSGWAHQGVLLLNASLTVEAHKAGSHAKAGWQEFTSAVIDHINRETEGLVFILWGRHAQIKGKCIDKSRHKVINGVHPSGLSANKGFFGSKPFSEANEYLVSVGKEPIDWRAPQWKPSS